MSDELKFFILLIEKYAYDRQRSTADVFREWEEKNLIQEIYGGYELYHTERIENAYEDIESLMATGRHVR